MTKHDKTVSLKFITACHDRTLHTSLPLVLCWEGVMDRLLQYGEFVQRPITRITAKSKYDYTFQIGDHFVPSGWR